MSSDRFKNNGARLALLIIDQGTKILRKYFDSIHSPATLTATMNAYHATLSRIRAINPTQMNLLFPPAGMPATTSKHYDITLLLILFRNICGLALPTATVWNSTPLMVDLSPEADLMRIKNYRNEIYAHVNDIGFDDTDFNTHWSGISSVLTRIVVTHLKHLSLPDPSGDIAYLRTCSLDADHYIGLLNEWHENDEKIEALVRESLKQAEKMEKEVDKNKALLHEIQEQTKITGENVDRKVVLERENLSETKRIGKTVKNLKSMIAAQWAVIFIFGIFSVSSVFLYSHFKEEQLDYSYSLNLSNSGFVGREWVFRELENITNSSDVRGVVLVAGVGWGKSAIVKQLINSSSSSAVIHGNIIGYHFCKYNDERTRDGGRFVKNLVQLISKSISEFKNIVEKDQSIKNELDNCKRKCFKKAIVEPLNKLTGTGRKNSYILIDAIDECLGKKERHQSVILNMLHSSVPDFPKWVKLIVTSRNQPLSSGKISNINGLSTLKIDTEDQRNTQDLRTYVERTLENFSVAALSTQKLIDLVLESSKGNFLFLERIIKLWKKYPHTVKPQAIPEDLGNIYSISFTERFEEDDLDHFEPLLEVLLAAYSPPELSELDKIMNHHYKNYNTRKIAGKLSEYFKGKIGQEPLEFHHQFFAEWLTNQTNGTYGITIQKARGHQYTADYLFRFYNGHTKPTLKNISELCLHILHAGDREIDENIKRLSFLDVSEVRDSRKRCILHDLASLGDANKIIAELMKQFDFIDIWDYKHWTPAMYAVEAGAYENVKLFIDNGANVNHTSKYTTCNWWDRLNIFSETPSIYYSMSAIAAYKGYENIANLLVRSGAEIEKADGCGWKPKYVAVVMGHFKIVQLYINNGALADTISLHHAAASNHTKIVEFLLNTGIRDACLPCEPGDVSWCKLNLSRFHRCLCETALHAAVSKDSIHIVKLILEYGVSNAVVNCKHGSGRTPLMEAFLRKNTRMVELLINAGANMDAECETSTTAIELFHECGPYETLYSRYCYLPVCNGYQVVDFAFAHGLWKMMTPFMSKGKLNGSSNNARWSPATVASIYDQVDFINTTYGNRINSIPHIETVLRYVAVCHSVETLKHFLSSKDLSKFRSVYEDGKTLLHFAVLGSSQLEIEDYVTKSCSSSACVCPNKLRPDIVDQKRFEAVKLLTKELVSDVNKQDKHGRTALHYAAVHALPKIVEVLIKAAADWSIEDQRADTAWEYALRERPVHFETSVSYSSTSDQLFGEPNITLLDEMTSHLIQNAAIKECDKRAKKLLDVLINRHLPISLYELFKSGLDVNCAREHFKYYLNELSIPSCSWWWKGPDEILEVFKIFQINVEVVCDVPLKQSELHLMSYLTNYSSQVGNLFQPSVNGTCFPLERFITSHPKGVDILNECYDKEGYLAIHRAVQGNNRNGVFWFIEIGVDFSRKTRSGLTALALATYNYRRPGREQEAIFDKLLKKTKEKSQANIYCSAERIDISPLHVAGSWGMEVLEIIHRKMPELPLSCLNSDGIQPIYLAYLYHATHSYLSPSDIQAFQNLGLSPDTAPSQYPKREAECHLIYNQLFYRRTPNLDMGNVLNHVDLFQCPDINEFLPHKTVIKYFIKLNECATRCWQVVFDARRAFLSNFPFLDIQNNISNPFSDTFINIAALTAELRFYLVKMFHFNSFHSILISTFDKKLWRKVTMAHSCAHNCSCFEIMLLLQERFTSEPRSWDTRIKIGEFVAQRMGWTDTSWDGDVLYRWPFRFLLQKALKTDRAYNYLEILDGGSL